MSLEPNEKKLLKQLIHQEVLLSKLYALFSRQFPKHKEFWVKLSKEESRHAKLLEKLFEATKTGAIFFDEEKIETYQLDTFLTRLEGIIDKAEREEFNLTSALACAVNYETSLIERNIFSYFDSLGDKAKGTLTILQSETMKHIEWIKRVQTVFI